MLRWLTIFLTLFICLIFANAVYAEQLFSAKQVKKIIDFYEILLAEKKPTVRDFYMLFGEDNEAELALILGKRFKMSQKDISDKEKPWFQKRDVASYIAKVNKYPGNFDSLFLKCLKDNVSKFFDPKEQLLISIQPQLDPSGPFKHYFVDLGNVKRIKIEFSNNENTIENIYLSDGNSIYNLCK